MRISDWSSDVCSSDLQSLLTSLDNRPSWKSLPIRPSDGYRASGSGRKILERPVVTPNTLPASRRHDRARRRSGAGHDRTIPGCPGASAAPWRSATFSLDRNAVTPDGERKTEVSGKRWYERV